MSELPPSHETGRLIGIRLHGAVMPEFEEVCAAQFGPSDVCMGLPLEDALVSADDGTWPSARFVTGRWPLAILPRGDQDCIFTILRSPRAMLAHWLAQDAPAVLHQLAGQGLPYELFREFFSPGFDHQRMRTDSRYGIGLHSAAYADGCTVDEALAQLSRVDAVLDGHDLDAALLRLIIQAKLQPPLVPPKMPTPQEPDLPEAMLPLLSEFDERFYQRARSAWAAAPSNIEGAYGRYIERYAVERGARIPPHTSLSWPLGGWVGPGWFRPEETSHGTHFRWSGEAPPILELPLANAGWYSVRIYLQPHGLTPLSATFSLRGSGRPSPMAAVQQGPTLTLDAHVHLPAADWLVIEFDHGTLPVRDSSDPRRRGFVLGDVHVRRVS